MQLAQQIFWPIEISKNKQHISSIKVKKNRYIKFKRIFISSICLLISLSFFAQHSISSGRLSITISEDQTDGIIVSSVKDNGTELLNTTTNYDLFTLYITNTLTGENKEIKPSSNWTTTSFDATSSEMVITLSGLTDADLPDNLQVVININTDDQNSSWDIAVSGLGDFSLMDVMFPELNIKADGNDTFFYPMYSGKLIPNPGDGFEFIDDPDDGFDNLAGFYPRGWGATMQYFAYYNANYGVYLGFHDPDANAKRFYANDENSGIYFACKFPIPDKTIASNNWELPGVFQLNLFDGDWYDAALIYKEWVSSEANFWPEDSPEREARQHKIGDIGVWLTTSDFRTIPVSDMENYLITAADFFDVPIGITIYGWNGLEMDHYYPNYFPELTGLGELITNLQDNHNATITPYINGRMWDTGIGGNDANDAAAATYFNNDGFASATKKSDGSLYIQPFLFNDFAVMCPTQPDWQDLLTDISDELTDRINANSVYLDMVAAAGPTYCMDVNHNHTLGGGSFWREGYNTLLENIHTTIPTDNFLTVEGGHEFLMNQVDGFMVQGWQTDNQVPAWQTIYTGKTQLFGTVTGGGQYPLQDFYGRLGQAFTFGVQTGRQYIWLAISQGNDDTLMAANYVKALSRMRYKLRNFMSYGEMKRPIIPESSTGTAIPTITYTITDRSGHADHSGHGEKEITTSAIQKSVWQNNNEVVVVFANTRIQSPAGVTGGAIPFQFDFNGTDYEFVGDVTIQKLTPTTDENIETENNTFTKNVILNNLELVAYKITGDNSASVETENIQNLVIYPNPMENTFTFNFNTNDIIDIKIYNSLGQLVITKVPEDKIVDVSMLPDGVYIVSIQTKNHKKHVSKLIKSNS